MGTQGRAFRLGAKEKMAQEANERQTSSLYSPSLERVLQKSSLVRKSRWKNLSRGSQYPLEKLQNIRAGRLWSGS